MIEDNPIFLDLFEEFSQSTFILITLYPDAFIQLSNDIIQNSSLDQNEKQRMTMQFKELMNVYQFIDDSKEKIYFRSENSIASYDIGTKKINRTKCYEKQMNCIIRIDDYTFMSKCQDSVVIWKKIVDVITKCRKKDQ